MQPSLPSVSATNRSSCKSEVLCPWNTSHSSSAGLSPSRGFGSQATGEWFLSSFVTPQSCQILLFVPIRSPAGLPQNPKGFSRCSPESESSLHSVFVEAEGVRSCVQGLKGTKPRPCLPEAKLHCQTGHSSLCMQRFQTLIDWLIQWFFQDIKSIFREGQCVDRDHITANEPSRDENPDW